MKTGTGNEEELDEKIKKTEKMFTTPIISWGKEKYRNKRSRHEDTVQRKSKEKQVV